jgi:glycine dehydrogenase subunit 2
MSRLPQFHAAKWDEPVVMEMGRPGGRGQIFPAPRARSQTLWAMISFRRRWQRKDRPELPEITEFEAQRHYLHLSQMTLGMMGVSLFGTCTMKYNSKTSEYATLRPELAEVHPYQHPDTLQGVLGILHDFDDILLAVGHGPVHLPGRRRRRCGLHHGNARPRLLGRQGQAGQRTEMVTSVQAHPCNPATAAAAGFKVVNLPLEENGYPSLEALKAAVSEKTALIMINNPDDMGIYNPEIKEWVKVAKEAGALCFYDHANFNGVMGKLSRARAGLRCLHVHAAQDLRRAEGRRRPGRGRLRLLGRAGALSAGPRSW